MGTDAEAGEKMVAIVACTGKNTVTSKRMKYEGLATCKAAAQHYAGGGKCQYGCIGLGDCMAGCPFGAINIENGVAVIDRSICSGCGVCSQTCPKGLIHMIPDSDSAFVTCSNKSKGNVAMKVCEESCIGCKRCEKECLSGAITVENNLAVIDTEKCTNCGACIAVCPRKTISYISQQQDKVKLISEVVENA